MTQRDNVISYLIYIVTACIWHGPKNNMLFCLKCHNFNFKCTQDYGLNVFFRIKDMIQNYKIENKYIIELISILKDRGIVIGKIEESIKVLNHAFELIQSTKETIYHHHSYLKDDLNTIEKEVILLNSFIN